MTDVNPDLIKRLVELVDGDGWEKADVLLEHFPVEQYGETDSGRNSGLYAALDATEDVLRKEYGIELKVNTMRTYRATAIAWPGEARSSPASFDTHLRLRGKNGHGEMQRYLKRNNGLPLSARHVQRYRADDNPKPVLAWEAQASRALESTAKRQMLRGRPANRADWWNAGPDESRDALIVMLRVLAAKMETTP